MLDQCRLLTVILRRNEAVEKSGLEVKKALTEKVEGDARVTEVSN